MAPKTESMRLEVRLQRRLHDLLFQIAELKHVTVTAAVTAAIRRYIADEMHRLRHHIIVKTTKDDDHIAVVLQELDGAVTPVDVIHAYTEEELDEAIRGYCILSGVDTARRTDPTTDRGRK